MAFLADVDEMIMDAVNKMGDKALDKVDDTLPKKRVDGKWITNKDGQPYKVLVTTGSRPEEIGKTGKYKVFRTVFVEVKEITDETPVSKAKSSLL